MLIFYCIWELEGGGHGTETISPSSMNCGANGSDVGWSCLRDGLYVLLCHLILNAFFNFYCIQVRGPQKFILLPTRLQKNNQSLEVTPAQDESKQVCPYF